MKESYQKVLTEPSRSGSGNRYSTCTTHSDSVTWTSETQGSSPSHGTDGIRELVHFLFLSPRWDPYSKTPGQGEGSPRGTKRPGDEVPGVMRCRGLTNPELGDPVRDSCLKYDHLGKRGGRYKTLWSLDGSGTGEYGRRMRLNQTETGGTGTVRSQDLLPPVPPKRVRDKIVGVETEGQDVEDCGGTCPGSLTS